MPLRYPHLAGLQWYASIPVTYDVDMDVESNDDDDDVIETNQGTDKGKGYSQKDKGYSHKGKGYSHKGKGYSHTDKGYSHTDKGYSHTDKGYSHPASSDNPEIVRCIGRQGTLGDSFSHGAHRLAMLQRQVQKTPHPFDISNSC